MKEPVEAASMPNANSPLSLFAETNEDYDFNLTEVDCDSDNGEKEDEKIDMTVEEHPEIKEEKTP